MLQVGHKQAQQFRVPLFLVVLSSHLDTDSNKADVQEDKNLGHPHLLSASKLAQVVTIASSNTTMLSVVICRQLTPSVPLYAAVKNKVPQRLELGVFCCLVVTKICWRRVQAPLVDRQQPPWSNVSTGGSSAQHLWYSYNRGSPTLSGAYKVV